MMNHVDIKYAQNLLSANFNTYKIKQRSPFLAVMRCPLCGDSHKNKNKMRGYLYTKKSNLNYRCHNCNAGMSFPNFLKEVDGALYNSYCMERFKNNKNEGVPVVKKKKNKITQSGLDVLFPKLSILEDDHPAVIYARSRRFPLKLFNKIYYCENSQKLKSVHPDFENNQSVDSAPRLIFPAYTRRGSLIGFCGRAIDDSKLRYTIYRLLDNYPFLFNIPNIDFDKRVYVVEGVIDSMFIPNCLAVGNSNLSSAYRVVKNRKDTVLIFDNEPRNKHIIKAMEKGAKMGFSIMIWPHDTVGKDINEMVQFGTSEEELLALINKNAYHGPKFFLNLMEWKRT